MSTLKADTLVALDGTSPVTLTKQSAAKAWFHYAQNGNTINDSFNTSSATDQSTGNFRQNITNAMSGTKYAALGATGSARVCLGHQEDSSGGGNVNTTSIAYWNSAYASNTSAVGIDMHSNCTALQGDLA